MTLDSREVEALLESFEQPAGHDWVADALKQWHMYLPKLAREWLQMRETLRQFESWTRNPRAYEPSSYTINHMCRQALGMDGGEQE